MTKSTNKPKRHPTFTLDELRAIRRALVNDESESSQHIKEQSSALSKVSSAIEYRQDQQREAHNHGKRTQSRDQQG